MPSKEHPPHVSAPETADKQLTLILQTLRDDLSLARATLRLDIPGEQAMPMTHEVLAPGVASVDGHVVAAAGSPTVTKLKRDRSWVVVSDCGRAAETDPDFDDDGFRAMQRDYGGLAAFIAAPLFEGDRLVGIVSLHHLGSPREWSEGELALVNEARNRIGRLRPQFTLERERQAISVSAEGVGGAGTLPEAGADATEPWTT